jgi:hypothetical protein
MKARPIVLISAALIWGAFSLYQHHLMDKTTTAAMTSLCNSSGGLIRQEGD